MSLDHPLAPLLPIIKVKRDAGKQGSTLNETRKELRTMRGMGSLENWELDNSTALTWPPVETMHTAGRYGRATSEETGLCALKRQKNGGEIAGETAL